MYHVIVGKEAMGKTDEEARNRLSKIQYEVNSRDSILDLPNGFAIDKSSKYRFQNVDVMVQVPVGKKVKIDSSVFKKLNDGQIVARDYKDSRRDGIISYKRRITRYRAGIDYTMDSTGKLVSEEDRETISTSNSNNENYRWDADSTAPATPQAPVTPAAPASPADAEVYRYDATPAKPAAVDTSKEKIRKELEQKQKELDELKKKLNQ